MTDYAPSANWDRIRQRARLLQRLRQFFDARGFLEVETPLLLPETISDRHLEPFTTRLVSDPRRPDQGPTLWLQTSPEAAMKRLMACGGEAIYQVTRSFRNGEQGPRHNPEFTIVEWYRRGDSLDKGMQFLSDLCTELLAAPAAERISYREAFQREVDCDPHSATAEELRLAAARHGIEAPQALGGADRDAWLDLLLALKIGPHLGRDRPTLLYDYPASQAALARVREGDAPVAERFELFYRGVELANGYHELTDAAELLQRCLRTNSDRADADLPTAPPPEQLLAAQRHGLPPCCGAALGFDRLLMLSAGAESLADVLTFPLLRG